MQAWCRLVAVIVAALTSTASLAVAADKPTKTSSQTTTVSTPGSEAKVNINTAGVKELATLDGIGHKVAERIVAYRDAHGPFKKPEDLRKVEGVGKTTVERNRERVVVK